MKRRLFLHAGAAFAGATFLIAAHAQGTGATAQKRHKLVIQVSDNDPAKWNLALNNAKNVQDDDGVVDVVIAIVV